MAGCVCYCVVQVWDVGSGAAVLELGVKSVNKESWPLLQWSQGDDAVYHGVTNTVHQYSKASGFKSRCPGSKRPLGVEGLGD